MKNLVLIVLSFFLSAECAPRVGQGGKSLNEEKSDESLNTINKDFNTTKTHYLETTSIDSIKNYRVVELQSGKVILEGKFVPGYIKWINDNTLELLSLPNNIPKEKNITDYIQIIKIPSVK